MGLKDVNITADNYYLVEYNIKEVEVEIYNTKGYEGNYSLTDIENL